MIQVLVPMGGRGSRVKDHYKTIKPLIQVNNKTLIDYVIDNVWCENAHYIFLTQRQDCEDYKLDEILQEKCSTIHSKCSVIQLDGLNGGPAASCLKAAHFIDNDYNLLLANSDQYCEGFSTKAFFKQMEIDSADAGILVFNDDSPKWSFVKMNKFGQVCRVVEKNPISDLATLGYYAWNKGSDFIKSTNQMIADDFKVNSEFYVAPTLDYFCNNGGIVKAYYSDKCFGTGTVQDIQEFEKYIKNK